MKLIVTIIATNVVANSHLSLFCPALETKNKNQVLPSWWSGNKKCFCFLFIAIRSLLQSHTESNRLL